MSVPPADRPQFRVETDGQPGGTTLLVALPQSGMANLTAADYLVQRRDAEQIGYVATDDLPAMTPVDAGVPRRHTRLFDIEGSDVSVLIGELFVPVWAAGGFTDAVTAWARDNGIAELVLLHGIPFPHAETEHAVYSVATPDYRERRPAADDYEALRGGFFDGVPGELLDRHLDETGLPIGVFVTPTHPPGPDIDAAIRLLEAVQPIYDLAVDLGDLEAAAERTRQYYAELAGRMEALRSGEEALGSRDYPEDRMFM